MSKVVPVPPTQDMVNCCASVFAEKLNCFGTRRAEVGTDGERVQQIQQLRSQSATLNVLLMFRSNLAEGCVSVETVAYLDFTSNLTLTCTRVHSWAAQEKAKEPEGVTVTAGGDAWGRHGGTVTAPSAGPKAACPLSASNTMLKPPAIEGKTQGTCGKRHKTAIGKNYTEQFPSASYPEVTRTCTGHVLWTDSEPLRLCWNRTYYQCRAPFSAGKWWRQLLWNGKTELRPLKCLISEMLWN